MQSIYFKKIKLPDKPGVYFFLGPPKRSEGGKRKKQILYIGKATSLCDRTKSYFSKDPEGKGNSYEAGLIKTRGPLIVKMVEEASKIDWQETESVLEALILEAGLIKKYQPYYNTALKDDKSFNYVCITREKLPKVILVRAKNLDQSIFSACYGPFTNGGQLKEAMKIIRRIFPFLDDKNSNYIEFYRQINLVPDLDDRKLYLQNVRNIKLFFSGRKPQIFRNLKRQMKEYVKMREFEKAGEVKRQMFALQHINDVALLKQESGTFSNFSSLRPSHEYMGGTLRKLKIEKSSAFRIEAYDIAHMGGKNMVGVMTVVEDGEAVKSEYKKFRIRTQNNTNDTGALTEVVERKRRHQEWGYPRLIVVDGGVAQINAAKAVMLRMNLKIEVVSVVKDERHKPKAILGDEEIVRKYKRDILLANSEAHRFAIAYHKKMRNQNFLK